DGISRSAALGDHTARGRLTTSGVVRDDLAPWRPHRLNAGGPCSIRAQDRLGTFQVITPGHSLVPPGAPEVGQRADKVRASCRPGGAPAADDDVERPVREP